MKYILTVNVLYEMRADDYNAAHDILKEKAKELADVVGDFGAYATEPGTIQED